MVSHWNDVSTTLEREQPLVWHFPYYHPEKRFHRSLTDIGVSDFATSQTRPHSAIRSGQWKLLYFYEDDHTELYDLTADIGEQSDLSTAAPKVARRLKSQLANYLKDVGARLPK